MRAGRLLLLAALPLLLLLAAIATVASGGGGSAAAACQVVAGGTVTGAGTGGAAGALTPLQVERYWVSAGGPLDAAITAAALADAESADITDRLQGSSIAAPTQPTPATPADPLLVGYGLWQITPGSPADYSPTVNAHLAVAKYEGSLTAGGGGWSPWTTYDTPGYLAALPAAQAAFSQLTAGTGGVSAAPTLEAPLQPSASAAAATPNTTAPTTPAITTATADQYITHLEGQNTAQYAVLDANGTVLASHHDTTLVDAGPATKAMILAAYLRAHPTGPIPRSLTAAFKSMLDNNAGGSQTQPGPAWRAYQAAGGAQAIVALAAAAGLTSFQINTTNPHYVLENSRIDALDLARLFAKLDGILPTGRLGYATKLLQASSSTNSWGLLQAGIGPITASAGGAIPQANGTYTVNQAAALTTPQYGQVAIAVTTVANPSASVGENSISNIATDLLGTATSDPLGYGLDLSGLTPAAQTQLYTAASQLASTGQDTSCANVSVSSVLPTVPGHVATINPTTGLAAAPTGLPASIRTTIDKLIAAGNTIHSLPYIWGGGHGAPLSQLAAGYDCSGSTSYMLYQAGLLATPDALVSGQYTKWGQPGPGRYITIFSNAAHVFIEVDGIVMDTAWYSSVAPTTPSSGPRWQPASIIQHQVNGDIADGNGGFTETHPAGF